NWFAAGKRDQFCDPNIFFWQARVEIFENLRPKKTIVDRGGKRRTKGVERCCLFAQLLDLCFRRLHWRIDLSDFLGAESRHLRGAGEIESPAEQRENNGGGGHYKKRASFLQFLPTHDNHRPKIQLHR